LSPTACLQCFELVEVGLHIAPEMSFVPYNPI
jgi:hypothetical protein